MGPGRAVRHQAVVLALPCGFSVGLGAGRRPARVAPLYLLEIQANTVLIATPNPVSQAIGCHGIPSR